MILKISEKKVRLAVLLLLVCSLVGCATTRQPGPVAEQEPSPAAPQGPQPMGGDIALLLPLSGPYAAIADQIINGANAAVTELKGQGLSVQLQGIDSFSSGWQQQLENLPPSFTVVGGPLRPDAFQDVVMAGMNRKRCFFTFLQTLSGATEGRDAWRFFSSPDDQIRTLLQTARGEFSISNVGVLYPDEPFGKRITKLFLDGASAQGVTVAATQAYPPEAPLEWSELVAQLLYEGGRNASIQAVFLPDVWSKVEMLVPYFFYHQREDLLLLGSTLWGQTLSESSNVDMHNFKLALFPAAWWKDSQAPAAVRLRQQLFEHAGPSFWEALGYDFVRFATSVGPMPPDWDAAYVNRRIRQAQTMNWSMAPISWTQMGEARQDLFLFTPTQQGMKPADLQEMRQRQQAVQSRLTN